jgi:hypothetical protein
MEVTGTLAAEAAAGAAGAAGGDGAIDEKYAALGGPNGFLGPAQGAHEVIANGRRRRYQSGHIYWSAATGACEVHGQILVRYAGAGAAAGFLGFPVTDELAGARTGTRVCRFERGGIWFSTATGAKEVHGAILVKYLALGGDAGFLGLPTSDEVAHPPGGKRSQFQGGVILSSGATGAFEVHGAILNRYNALGGSSSFLGLPMSDETDIKGVGGLAGKLSRFSGGTIYSSPSTGAFEVHGAIRELYEQRGGPAAEMGFPTTNETVISPQGVRYNGFQNGVIAWKGATGAIAICDLELRLGLVRSGSIDDGVGDSSAELITYTTVRVDGAALETNVRRPRDHAGTSFNINTAYAIRSVRPSTTFSFEIKIEDWDRISANDYLGHFRRTFDISTMWGLTEGQGVVVGMPLTQKGGDAPSLSSVKLDFSVRPTRPSMLDPKRTFREQYWWSFDNFKTAKLTQQQYADTFRDVGHRTNWFEKAVHPWDSLFYLAYEGLAAKGNCFGISVEGALARTCRSLYSEPIFRFSRDAGAVQTFNLRHGYQIGDSSVRWILGKLTTLAAVRPRRVYDGVRAALARGDWPLLSMFDLKSFNGHTVLAYECPPVTSGQPLVIRVADPNHPFASGGTLHPTYIEIDPVNDTFKFVTPNGVKYQSQKILDKLPGTLMLETPISVVAGHPRTPFWEFAALLALLGGLVILAGDADAEQLTADGQNLYGPSAGGFRTIAAGGANGWLRLPVFDHAEATAPQLFAKSGAPSGRLDLTLRGRRAGSYRQYLRTPREAILLEAPSEVAQTDTVRVRQEGLDTRVEVDTTGRARAATVGLGSIADPGRGVALGAAVSIGLAPGQRAVVAGTRGRPGIVVLPAGPARPLEVVLERATAGVPQRVAVTVAAGVAGEGVTVRPADAASPLGQMEVTRVTAGGQPTGRPVERVQQRALTGPLPTPFRILERRP